MVWGKRDDSAWQNEHLIGLSHEAYRLYDVALSFCASEWPAGEGCLSRSRAESLARMHRVSDPAAAIEELRTSGRWERRARAMFHVHDIEKYMPPANLSEKRSNAGVKGANARWHNQSAMANAMDARWQGDGSGTPDPVPEEKEAKAKKPELSLVVGTSTATSNGSVTKHRPPSKREPSPEVVAFTDVWTTACAPLPRLLKPPGSHDGQRLVMQTWRVFDGDVAMLDRAIRLFALDPWNREHGYGFETFCRHPDTWLGKAATAPVVASAASSWDS